MALTIPCRYTLLEDALKSHPVWPDLLSGSLENQFANIRMSSKWLKRVRIITSGVEIGNRSPLNTFSRRSKRERFTEQTQRAHRVLGRSSKERHDRFISAFVANFNQGSSSATFRKALVFGSLYLRLRLMQHLQIVERMDFEYGVQIRF